MLTDKITEEAVSIYRMAGVEIRPKWFPVFSVLSQGETKTITAMAREIGHTHPSVSRIVREMAAEGLVCERRDAADGRTNRVMLSEKGRQTAARLTELCEDVSAAIERIDRETENDLWRAIEEWEELLAARSLFQRVKEARRSRESRRIRLVPYEARYGAAFRALNEAWITEHWRMEAADYEALDHPQEHILEPGGYIAVALYDDEPVGVCALCRFDHSADYDYELAKLAVSPAVRGLGIGRLLCEAVIDEARRRGAKRLFLESNRRLEPAVALYRALGFRELRECRPAYARGDIQMELTLKKQ